MISTNFNPASVPGSPLIEEDKPGSTPVTARIWKCAACGASFGFSKPESDPGACTLCGGSTLVSQDIARH